MKFGLRITLWLQCFKKFPTVFPQRSIHRGNQSSIIKAPLESISQPKSLVQRSSPLIRRWNFIDSLGREIPLCYMIYGIEFFEAHSEHHARMFHWQNRSIFFLNHWISRQFQGRWMYQRQSESFLDVMISCILRSVETFFTGKIIQKTVHFSYYMIRLGGFRISNGQSILKRLKNCDYFDLKDKKLNPTVFLLFDSECQTCVSYCNKFWVTWELKFGFQVETWNNVSIKKVPSCKSCWLLGNKGIYYISYLESSS